MKTKLKELRKINNLSMDKLGKEINMSSGEISDIENGKKRDPRISTLIRIADYFNISLDELIGLKEKRLIFMKNCLNKKRWQCCHVRR